MDEETKKEWEKSKRIETERMKAVQALEEDESIRINSAFLDVKPTRLKGYERDTESSIRSIERAADFSVGAVILGIVIRFAISMIPLPLGMLANVIRLIGVCLLGISVILAVGALGYVFYYRKKTKFKFKSIVITAAVALVITIVYIAMNFTLIIAGIMI